MSLSVPSELWTKSQRAFKALWFGLCSPRTALSLVKTSCASLYAEGLRQDSPLETLDPEPILQAAGELRLLHCKVQRDASLYLELLLVSALVKLLQPKLLLEIGTLGGDATLQMALNAPEEARVYTFDLPRDVSLHKAKRLDPGKSYEGTSWETKIRGRIEDSSICHFEAIDRLDPLDFCFIRGCLSYESLRENTEQVLERLSSTGVILWSHYHPSSWEGYSYLNELSTHLDLYALKGSRFALYVRGHSSWQSLLQEKCLDGLV